ncbi:DUF2486 family protein [Pseudomonas sp. KT_2_4]|uniref:DUF2486 family protein n=1 Tax=Pseudomonas TaxID=286 RepID=UPI00352BB965
MRSHARSFEYQLGGGLWQPVLRRPPAARAFACHTLCTAHRRGDRHHQRRRRADGAAHHPAALLGADAALLFPGR